MSDSFEDIWSLTVSDLKIKHNKTALEYEEHYKQLLRMEAVLQEKKEKLSRLNKEAALSDRHIRDQKNNTFRLNKKRADLRDALTLLNGGIEKKEAKLFKLTDRKKELKFKIKTSTEAIHKESSELVDIKKNNLINKKKILVLEKEKKKLSDDISRFLSETSIERDAFEKKAQELNGTFVQILAQRFEIRKHLTEIEKEREATLAEIDEFRNQIEHVNEIKRFKESIVEKEQAQKAFGIQYSKLQIELLNKRERLDAIVSRVDSVKNKIAPLMDDKLLKFDQLISDSNNHKIELQTLSEEQKQSRDEILELMIEKSALEENQDVIWQRIESLETDLLEVAK
ncbi:MAG: hypothetical protein HQK67_11625 [Desulfamplus sp.]|nr:hypothetical protein [Desulfamplus sp.]